MQVCLCKLTTVSRKIEEHKKKLQQEGYKFLFEKNISGERVLIFCRICESSIRILAFPSRKKKRTPYPFIAAVYGEIDKSIEIGDVRVGRDYINKGYGSMLLQGLFIIADELGVKRVFGDIFPVDYINIDRLKHFYEKHGFTVQIDNDNSRGKFYKQI